MALSGGLRARDAPAVVGESDQGPLGGDVLQATQAGAEEAKGAFDDPEHRFDRLLALFVEGFGIVGLQLGFHGDAPGFGDPSGRFRFRGRAEVIPIRENADWYARGVGGAAAREIKDLYQPATWLIESINWRAGMTGRG